MEGLQNMESVSFKAYLKRNGQEVEVRRFGIDAGAVTSYMYLRGKIQAVFPSLQNDQFSVFWQDSEQDYIVIDSDEELRQALYTLVKQMPIKLYVNVKIGSTPQGGNGEQLHPGVTCDGCEGAMVGFRYKCVTCPDYDLCSTCEMVKLHPEHFMLRIPAPLMGSSHAKVFRKFFGRPHKFHKRHGWFRMPETPSFSDSQGPMGAGRCPYSRREGPAPGPMGMTDMFDFSALLEFINSLGLAPTGESEVNDASAKAQASSSSQTQPDQSTSSQTQSSQTTNAQERRRNNDAVPTPAEYLSSVGQAIVNFLDPLGVNVTFDVRPPAQAEVKKPATSQPATTTTPSQGLSTANASAPVATPGSVADATPTPASSATPGFATASTPVFASSATPGFAAASTPVSVSSPALGFMTASTPASVSSATLGFETTSTPAVQSSATPGFTVTSAPMTSVVQMVTPQCGSSSPARRNSDDWTLLNRESPTRGEEVAMDVDENRGAKPKTVYPELPKDVPSAPPQTDAAGMLDVERERIQEAIERIRSMGFNFETTVLRDLLKKENCDIASVLEMILTARHSD